MSHLSEWIRCPFCGNKMRLQIRKDTELKNFPLYCPKCKQENLIDVKKLHITIIKNDFNKDRARRIDAEPTNLWNLTVCWLLLFTKKIFKEHQMKMLVLL